MIYLLKNYMNKFTDLIWQTLKGKTFYRMLFNWKVAEYCVDLQGICVDLGCGKKPTSYSRYWKIRPEKLIRIDSDKNVEPDISADLNNGIPLEDNFADNIFLFNSFYMIKEPERLLKEIHRILKSNGHVFLTAQFIKSEEANVSDLHRFTRRKLKEMLSVVGFNDARIVPVGERFSAVCNLEDFVLGSRIYPLNFLKIFPRVLCLLLDKITPKKLKQNYPCPIAWFVIAKK